MILLPALEKAPEELSNLGKVIISSLKAMMSSGLGSEVEGTYGELITRKPTNAETPFMCVMDEYGYLCRGKVLRLYRPDSAFFRFLCILPDKIYLPSKKHRRKKAASIGANTNIKICMKLKDPVEPGIFL